MPRRAAAVQRLALAAALSLLVLLAAGPASALAGPGVRIKRNPEGTDQHVLGSQIGGGLSLRRLLLVAGFSVENVDSITITGEAGNAPAVLGSELDSAFVSDQGGTTRFFRPGRPGDDVRSSGTQPLRMEIDGSALLSIDASASATRVKVGETIDFGARLRVTPPGANVQFTWDFGDGSAPRIGDLVSHRFTIPGPLLVVVRALGSGGACAQSCTAEEEINVEVTGQDRDRSEAPGAPGGSGSTGGLGGTGSGGSGSGSGTGNGSGASDGATAAKPPPLRAERPEPDSPFSADPDSGKGRTIVRGVLISGPGRPIEGGLPEGAAGGSPKAAKGVPGTVDDPFQLAFTGLLALAVVMLGALRERRRVTLRIA